MQRFLLGCSFLTRSPLRLRVRDPTRCAVGSPVPPMLVSPLPVGPYNADFDNDEFSLNGLCNLCYERRKLRILQRLTGLTNFLCGRLKLRILQQQLNRAVCFQMPTLVKIHKRIIGGRTRRKGRVPYTCNARPVCQLQGRHKRIPVRTALRIRKEDAP